MAGSNNIFVYGTLRRGFRNHALLRNARYLGPHTTGPEFTMLDLGAYPGVVSGGTTPIVGELYALTPRILNRLDVLEDYPSLYTRILVATPRGHAWMYLYRQRPFHRPVVASGDWRRRANGVTKSAMTS